jgi:hypothetical protein
MGRARIRTIYVRSFDYPPFPEERKAAMQALRAAESGA